MEKPVSSERAEPATVLIVDDYLTVAEIVERRLRSAGMRTRTCAGGAEAMEVLRSEHVDLVILDVMMPEVDGYAVMRFIREQPRTSTLPVIILTACTNEEDVKKATDLGADCYVTKPFNGGELVGHAKRLIARQRRAA